MSLCATSAHFLNPPGMATPLLPWATRPNALPPFSWRKSSLDPSKPPPGQLEAASSRPTICHLRKEIDTILGSTSFQATVGSGEVSLQPPSLQCTLLGNDAGMPWQENNHAMQRSIRLFNLWKISLVLFRTYTTVNFRFKKILFYQNWTLARPSMKWLLKHDGTQRWKTLSVAFTALTPCHLKFLIHLLNVPGQLELYLWYSANSKWLYWKHLKLHQLTYRVQWAMHLGMKEAVTSLLFLQYNAGKAYISKARLYS